MVTDNNGTPILIPELPEYGYIHTESGELYYKPSLKHFWSRLDYVVGRLGGKVIKSTTGFEIENIEVDDNLSKFIQEEYDKLTHFNTTPPEDTELTTEGRESPNLNS